MNVSTTSKWDLSREDIKSAAKDEKELLLEHDSDPDENMLFNQPSTSAETKVDGKMDNVRLQIQEVTEVMRENVQKVMERGERLEDLQEVSDRLSMVGNEFRAAAKKAQQRAWLQNFKTRIVLVTITVTVVVCIIVTARTMAHWRVVYTRGAIARRKCVIVQTSFAKFSRRKINRPSGTALSANECWMPAFTFH
ncbi:vesicle-associated membrane protein 4-like isoform X1 [Bombus huntii]|uniref:vesicle-associated membrane protein 4-like isoform X1 n=1 Tax=Bombus huntii TaxID=85661 RepID=UPI0021AA8FAB|nr:vesicle-associated membrane protein 4-like isoform X1 [Bombus huntii]